MKIAVIGLGYVGLVSGVGLAARGHEVVGVDVVPEKAAAIGRGEVPFHEPGLPELLAENLAAGRFRVTTDLTEALAGAHVSMIAVGTPSGPEGIDLQYVAAAAEAIGRALPATAPGHVVCVKSTVVPGSTDGLVAEALARGAGRPDAAGLAMNPEFLREGSAMADFMAPDRIVVGADSPAAADAIAALYAGFEAPLLRTSLRDAEAIKYATNALLALMVSYSNELAGILEATPGTDVDVVMDGLHLDRRLTFVGPGPRRTAELATYLRAGMGFGGSCLPKDVEALRAHGQAVDAPTPLLDAVLAVNRQRPERVLRLLDGALGGLAGREVAVLGLAFKAGTDDVRASSGLAAASRLVEAGARVRVHDPLVGPGRVELCAGVLHAATAEAALAGADAALIATAWPEYRALDWAAIAGTMRRALVLDGRNALRRHVWPAAITYIPIGRAPAPRSQEGA